VLPGDVFDEVVVVVLQDRPHPALHGPADVGRLEDGARIRVEAGLEVGEHRPSPAAAPGGVVAEQVQLPGREAHPPVGLGDLGVGGQDQAVLTARGEDDGHGGASGTETGMTRAYPGTPTLQPEARSDYSCTS